MGACRAGCRGDSQAWPPSEASVFNARRKRSPHPVISRLVASASQRVDVDRGQLVYPSLKDIPVVVDLHEFGPVGGRRKRCQPPNMGNIGMPRRPVSPDLVAGTFLLFIFYPARQCWRKFHWPGDPLLAGNSVVTALIHCDSRSVVEVPSSAPREESSDREGPSLFPRSRLAHPIRARLASREVCSSWRIQANRRD